MTPADLRALSRAEHSDLSIAKDAADEIERLRAENAKLSEALLGFYSKGECARLLYGECSTRACLQEGGWKSGDGSGYDKATCPQFKAHVALAKPLPEPPK